MTTRLLLVLCLGSIAGALSSLTSAAVHAQVPVARRPVPGAPAGIAAFVDVAVVPMDTDRVLRNQTVLVENGWITAFGPTSKIRVPAGATKIDGQGKYLMPGLADMHAHFLANDSIEIERKLFEALAYGITTIRVPDAFLVDNAPTVSFKKRAAAGQIWSPWISLSGPWGPEQYIRSLTPELVKTPSGMMMGAKPGDSLPAPRLDSVAAYLAKYKAAGYDFIKLYFEDPAILDSLFVAARRVGLPIVSHMYPQAFAASVKSIEHGYPEITKALQEGKIGLDSARAFALALRNAGIWTSPGPYTSGPLIKILQDVGAGMLLGADCFGAGPVGHQVARFVKEGLTPYQALVTGTRNVAAYFGTQDQSGTVAVGKRADLLLLDSNPLTELRIPDVETVMASGGGPSATPAGVMIGGRWLSRAELDRRWAEIKSSRVAEGKPPSGYIFCS